MRSHLSHQRLLSGRQEAAPLLDFHMLGVFNTDNPKWIGIVVLEFWRVYFYPIGILLAKQ
ncbi:hypothetical protein E5991_02810 [Bifidobacterium pseudolongum]|uniref:Uncharacterized protein n=1 Tax=Bifidobacterium pseudolongum TaxID=1694 RepID=A0A4S4FAM7_9BIFI|nr:hypothetical protein E5991_02810 [Bifidobacterium pseudolongum]